MIPRALWVLGALALLPSALAQDGLPPPQGLRVDAGNQVLQIAWDPLQGANLSHYAVYVFDDDDLVQRINATQTEATFRGVNGRPYAVQVAAVAPDGTEGARSAPVAGMPRAGDDLTFLAAGLIVVWVGLWAYHVVLDRVERNLREQERMRGGDAPR